MARTNTDEILIRKIQQLASGFAEALVEAIVAAPVGELAALEKVAVPGVTPQRAQVKHAAKAAPPAKRVGGAPAAKGDLVEQVRGLVRGEATGLGGEEIRKNLRIEKAAFLRAMKEGIADGRLRKTGDRRGTRYFAAGAGA